MVKWNDLPPEIQEKMLERQVEQGNRRNPEIFKNAIMSGKTSGGFDWHLSIEKGDFWDNIIGNKNDFRKFYKKYPNSLIKVEYQSLYKKTFRVNRILENEIDLEKIRELNLEYILK